jgi:hypothetical protein
VPLYNHPAMKMDGISRLERLVRETVEGSFGRLFGGYLEPMDVATQLVLIMDDNKSSEDLPNFYTITLNPEDYRLLLAQNPNLARDIGDAAWKLGRRYGLPLVSAPKIDLKEGENIRRHSFRIGVDEQGNGREGVDTTQVIAPRVAPDRALASLLELDAFLIVQGKNHVALDKPLLTLGRRPDNDIVLDSKSVSRQHAQIRWRFDRFILYDVSNRQRTKVNGETVSQHVLQQGDVIALSDTLLIYGEGRERRKFRDRNGQLNDSNTMVIPPARK